MDQAPKLSLILGTLGRTSEVARLLDSLREQDGVRLELIVVDQNPDDRLLPVLALHGSGLTLLHLRSQPGLSRARNVGLPFATGDFVAFPDDDCWYPPKMLATVADRFQRDSTVDVLCGVASDPQGDLILLRAPCTAVNMNRYNVWDLAISFAIFMRAKVPAKVGTFDPELGVGSGTRYESGEESDYLIRSLARGFSLRYEPALVVHHPAEAQSANSRTFAKARRYGIGMGHVLNKHRYPLWFRGWVILRPLLGALIALFKGQISMMRLRVNRSFGRANGVLFD